MLVLLLLFCFSVISGSSYAQTPDTLYFLLDMRNPLESGWLNPTVETVGLRGNQSPLSWSSTYPAHDPDGDGYYEAEVPFEVTQDSLVFSYKIKVDGSDNPDNGWQSGRNHSITLQKGISKRVRLAWEDEAAPPPSTITGNVATIEGFESDSLLPRNIYIYLPPAYKENGRRYPVLYMHDGQNLFDASHTGHEWQMDEAAESLIKDGTIEPLIIVGIANTPDRIDEYTPTRQTWHHEMYRVTPPTAVGRLQNYTGSYLTDDGDSLHFSAHKDTLFAMIPGSKR